MRRLPFIALTGWSWSAWALGAPTAAAPPGRQSDLARHARANEHGCFNCHSAPNNRELTNPGSPSETVPSFAGGNLMMYVDRPEEIREWIRDGTLPRAAPTQARGGASCSCFMPAFKDTVDEDEIEAPQAYLLAVDDYFSPRQVTKRGEEVARQQCMSSQRGRSGGLRNPRSPFGYIPAFYGPDSTIW